MKNEFWKEFENHSIHIRELIFRGEIRIAFETIDGLLKASGFDLIFDITSDKTDAILYFSAEGSRELAYITDQLFKEMPGDIPGWRIYPRRQKKALSDAITTVRNMYGVDPAIGRCRIEEIDGRVNLIMYHPAFSKWSQLQRDGFVSAFFESALGEEAFEMKVVSVNGVAEPIGPSDTVANCVSRLEGAVF